MTPSATAIQPALDSTTSPRVVHQDGWYRLVQHDKSKPNYVVEEYVANEDVTRWSLTKSWPFVRRQQLSRPIWQERYYIHTWDKPDDVRAAFQFARWVERQKQQQTPAEDGQ